MNIAFIGLAASMASTGVITAMANIAIGRVTKTDPRLSAKTDSPELFVKQDGISKGGPPRHGNRVTPA